jgi:hypothetical protein
LNAPAPAYNFMPIEQSAQAWTAADVAAQPKAAFYDLSTAALREIDAAVEEIRRRKLTLPIIEQEDFRVPSFAKDVPDLRRRLDEGFGFIVIRGLNLSAWSRPEMEMVYWGIGNYLGRVMRQNLRGERLDKVMNLGEEKVTDPYRVIETPLYFQPHTDNGMLEPRPPHYLGLMCIRNADAGGHSLLISAYAIHNTIRAEHPEYLPRLYQRFHIEPPIEQRLPGRPALWSNPVFEWNGKNLTIHYIRYLMDPGMEKAGTPLTPNEKAILDYIDSILRRKELLFEYCLQPGEILIENNLHNLHGRTAFTDAKVGPGSRELRRIWLWRRHGPVGMDPVELDRVELAI